MPIHFNEGLPRSGKSYSAIKDYIIPALVKGRHVYAHIDGLNPDALAKVAGIPGSVAAMLLHPLTADDLKGLPQKVRRDSLVVVDEVQNYYPQSREKLSPELMKFITEHGHLGIDILLMGQCMADVHAIWRRRVTQKTVFLKMEGLGAAGRYQWTVYKATRAEKFQESARSGMTGDPYEAKYFPCYQSFDPATENTSGTFYDKRAVIFHSSFFKLWLPLALIGCGVGVWYMSKVFSTSAESNPFLRAQSATIAKVQGIDLKPIPAREPDPIVSKGAMPAERVAMAPEPVLDEITRGLVQGVPRLAGVVWSASGKAAGLVEVGGAGGRMYTFEGLRAMGWELHVSDGVLKGSRDGLSFVAASFVSRRELGVMDKIAGQNLLAGTK